MYAIRHLMTNEGGAPRKPWIRLGSTGSEPTRYNRTLFASEEHATMAIRYVTQHEKKLLPKTVAVEAVPEDVAKKRDRFVVRLARDNGGEHRNVRLDEGGVLLFARVRHAIVFADEDSAKMAQELVAASTNSPADLFEVADVDEPGQTSEGVAAAMTGERHG